MSSRPRGETSATTARYLCVRFVPWDCVCVCFPHGTMFIKNNFCVAHVIKSRKACLLCLEGKALLSPAKKYMRVLPQNSYFLKRAFAFLTGRLRGLGLA